MKLHHAIDKVLTEEFSIVEAGRAEARKSGKPLSAIGKRTFRNYEQRRTSVRREGLRNDYQAVIEGVRSGPAREGDEEKADVKF